MEGQNLPRTDLAHYELENVTVIIFITIIIVIIITIIIIIIIRADGTNLTLQH